MVYSGLYVQICVCIVRASTLTFDLQVYNLTKVLASQEARNAKNRAKN